MRILNCTIPWTTRKKDFNLHTHFFNLMVMLKAFNTNSVRLKLLATFRINNSRSHEMYGKQMVNIYECIIEINVRFHQYKRENY